MKRTKTLNTTLFIISVPSILLAKSYSHLESRWLMQRVPSSSSRWVIMGGGGGGRELLIWCLIITLNSLFSLTRPSHYVVGDITGCEQLFRVPGTTTGHVRTRSRYYMWDSTYLSFSVRSNPTNFKNVIVAIFDRPLYLLFCQIVSLE